MPFQQKDFGIYKKACLIVLFLINYDQIEYIVFKIILDDNNCQRIQAHV